MNTTITTKRAASASKVSTFAVSVLALIAAIGILAAAAYIGTISKTGAAQTQNAVPGSVALDQHERQANAVLAGAAANAMLEQRRGEWVPVAALSGDNALLEQRRSEWAPVVAMSKENALLDQRRGEWLAGAESKAITCNVLTDLQERARCLGVR